jgi:hypothetical protein
MKLRPSPALVVAVLALVVAMTGTSYAAVKIGSAQIKNNSIKSLDVKDQSLTGKDVQDGSLAAADVQDGSLAGADVQDGSLTGADVADRSLTSADVNRSCTADDVAVMGVCIDKAAAGPSSFAAALADCDAKAGRLMSWPEYKVLVGKAGVTWADGNPSQYEFLDVQNLPALTPNAVSFGGSAFGDASGSTFWHRCVTYP